MSERAYIVLLADIHANRGGVGRGDAPSPVSYDRYGPLRIWFLGDLFGRGPSPLAGWRRLMSPSARGAVGWQSRLGAARQANIRCIWPPGAMGSLIGTTSMSFCGIGSSPADIGTIQLDDEGRPGAGPIYEAISHWPIVAEPIPGIYLLHGGLCGRRIRRMLRARR